MNGRLPRRAGIALFVAAMAAHAQPIPAAGFRILAVPAPSRGGMLEVGLWYPAAAGTGTPARIGANAVFAGTPAWPDAQLPPGPLPLVLLAHGGLRAAPHTGGWLAASLAARGFVVAAPRPAGPPPETAGAALPELWLRPADLSATLTALLSHPDWAIRIDAARVSALGVLLGGTACLALAGARFDPARFARSCADIGAGLDCAAFAREGIDLARVDATLLAASHHDARIGAVVAVDPELATSFAPASLAAIATPVRLVRLGPAFPALDAAPLAAIPGVRRVVLPGATRFAAFGACTPRGAAILREAGEAASLCEVPDRDVLQARLAELVLPGLR